MDLETPVTRLDAAEMALYAIELERAAEKVGHGNHPFDQLITEANAKHRACIAYLKAVEESNLEIGHKGPQQYMLDACVLLNAAMAKGNPPRDELMQAANAASLALATMRKRR